ncbi:hypothetical protein [Anthocerotibacter panamensis]|nr:hypothetical protein [Anthocerotibacter panamensis]
MKLRDLFRQLVHKQILAAKKREESTLVRCIHTLEVNAEIHTLQLTA